MRECTGDNLGNVSEAQSCDFYDRGYGPQWQSLYEMIRREVYDDYFGQFSFVSTANYDRIYRWLDVAQDSRVLDIACGRGAPALRLARSAGCMVVGVDNNAHAIDKATALAHEHGLSERVRFERYDASQSLPFPNSAFDALTCIDALPYMDRPRAFAEWLRVIKPGGRLVFTDQVHTGPISAAELAARSTTSSAMRVPSGYNERLLGAVGFELLRWEDMSATTAEIAERHCAARKAHADALRASEGDVVFEEQNRYRAVAARLARERRLSHLAFFVRKPV